MVNTRTIVIGIAASPSQWVSGGWNAVLTKALFDIESSGLDVIVSQYFVLTPEQTADAAATFLTQYKSYTRKGFIAASGSADLVAADAVLRPARVPVFSVGASAHAIADATTTSSAISYAPGDRNATMFFFVMHFLYARANMYVIYDNNDLARRLFIDSYLEDVRNQAAVFGITVCVQTVEMTTSLPDNSSILLLAGNSAIAFAGADAMNCATPNSSFIMLTDINSGARASYFGSNVIPLCMMMYPLDYTQQTREITSLFTREQLKTVSPYIFALYDCIIALAKFSLTTLSISIAAFVQFNIKLTLVPFAAFIPNKYLCPSVRGPCFCRYNVCYLRQQLLTDPALYLARFVGGTSIFPDAYGTLYQFGFARNATSFFMEQNRFLRMRDATSGALVMEKFDVVEVDLEAAGTQPPELLNPVQTGQTLLLGAEFARNTDDVPLFLERLQIYSGTIAPSQTMGKTADIYDVTPACRT